MTVAAVLMGSLMMASPAHADFLGPIQNYGNGLCMQPAGNSAQSGTLIVQEPCDYITTGQRNLFQEWDPLCTNGDLNARCDIFFWKNRGSQLCLRARGLTGPANGEQIMLWDCNQISDVRWSFGQSPVSSTFTLVSRLFNSHGFCLDVPGQSAAPGQALQLYQCNQTVAQIWQYIIVIQ